MPSCNYLEDRGRRAINYAALMLQRRKNHVNTHTLTVFLGLKTLLVVLLQSWKLQGRFCKLC